MYGPCTLLLTRSSTSHTCGSVGGYSPLARGKIVAPPFSLPPLPGNSQGLPVATTKLALYVVAAAICGLAGAFNVNLQGYVSPAQLHWTQSGTLMVMVILGGAGRVWGGVLGAAALLLLEEALSAQTVYWEFWTGAVLLAVVLLARNGLSGLFDRWASKGPAS